MKRLRTGIDIITAVFIIPSARTAIITGGWHHPKSYPFSMGYTVLADGGTVEYSSIEQPAGAIFRGWRAGSAPDGGYEMDTGPKSNISWIAAAGTPSPDLCSQKIRPMPWGSRG